MKRTLLVLSCIVFLFLISSCGNGETDMSDNRENGYVYLNPPEGGADCTEYVCKSVTPDCKKIIMSSGTFIIDGKVELNCDVELSAGTKITVSERGSFTVNGNFIAGKRKVFSGDGEIRLNMPETYGYTDWMFNTVRENPNDQTELIQKSFDSLSRFYLTDEGYKVSEIIVSMPVSVVGLGTHRVPMTSKTGVNRLFTIRSSDVSFENLMIEMGSAEKGNVCFFFDTSENIFSNFSAKDVYINRAYTSFADADGKGSFSGVDLSGITMQISIDTQLVFRSVSNIRLIDFAVLRRHGDGVSCNMPGLVIENADCVVMEHVDVNGDWTDKSGTEGHGIVMRNCRNVKMRKILMEYISGTGFIFENCSDFDLENIQTYTFKNNGIYIDGLKNSTIRIIKVTNGNSVGQDDDASKKENYVLKNCENVVFDSVISNFANNTGMLIEGCRDMTVNGFIYADVRSTVDAFALLDAGGNENVVINGFTDESNVSKRKGKSYSLTGSGVTIKSALLAMNKYFELITEGGEG